MYGHFFFFLLFGYLYFFQSFTYREFYKIYANTSSFLLFRGNICSQNPMMTRNVLKKWKTMIIFLLFWDFIPGSSFAHATVIFFFFCLIEAFVLSFEKRHFFYISISRIEAYEVVRRYILFVRLTETHYDSKRFEKKTSNIYLLVFRSPRSP